MILAAVHCSCDHFQTNMRVVNVMQSFAKGKSMFKFLKLSIIVATFANLHFVRPRRREIYRELLKNSLYQNST